MSHWQGTWRKKEYESLKDMPQRIVHFFDPDSDNIGKNDEELLRIYYFRKPQTRRQGEEPRKNIAAKTQLQSAIQQSNEENHEQEQQREREPQTRNKTIPSNKIPNRREKFATSSATQSSQFSNFSQDRRYQ